MSDSHREDLIGRLATELLIVAALFDGASGDALDRAEQIATGTRDRQLVAIAAAHLDGDHDRAGALIRDHLVDFPAHPIVSWIAASSRSATEPESGARS